MVSKIRPVKRLLADIEVGSGKAQVLEKPSELSHLLWVASRGIHGIRNRLIIWMLFGSGLRINEVAQLKVKDVLTSTGGIKPVFTVPGSYTKTGNPRAAFILAHEHIETLREWLLFRVDNQAMLSISDDYMRLNPDSSLILFAKGRNWRNPSFQDKKYPDKDGNIKTTKVCRTLENLARDIIKSAGFTHGSSHSGRRTLATWLNRKKYSLELIQMILGHENPDMTLVYIEPWRKRIDEAFQKTLGNIKLPKSP